jgi:hypothetical protein
VTVVGRTASSWRQAIDLKRESMRKVPLWAWLVIGLALAAMLTLSVQTARELSSPLPDGSGAVVTSVPGASATPSP